MVGTKPRVGLLDGDLRRYLRGRRTIFPPSLAGVVGELYRFLAAACRDGFGAEFSEPDSAAEMWSAGTFVEVCGRVVERRVRGLDTAERGLVAKSLFEAFVDFANPAHAFEPVHRTRFMRNLRHRGPRAFVGLFLSLYLFNVVCGEITEDVAAGMADPHAFGAYLTSLEAACREMVARSMQSAAGDADEPRMAAIGSNLELQLRRVREGAGG